MSYAESCHAQAFTRDRNKRVRSCIRAQASAGGCGKVALCIHGLPHEEGLHGVDAVHGDPDQHAQQGLLCHAQVGAQDLC